MRDIWIERFRIERFPWLFNLSTVLEPLAYWTDLDNWKYLCNKNKSYKYAFIFCESFSAASSSSLIKLHIVEGIMAKWFKAFICNYV